jgi:hypothetical protein
MPQRSRRVNGVWVLCYAQGRQFAEGVGGIGVVVRDLRPTVMAQP